MLIVSSMQRHLNFNSVLTRLIFKKTYIIVMNVISFLRGEFLDIIVIIIAKFSDKVRFFFACAKNPASQWIRS